VSGPGKSGGALPLGTAVGGALAVLGNADVTPKGV
jgi:hypothetical protein